MVLELSASIPALYGERPFAAACKAAAADGFGSVEMWAAPDPSEWADAVRALTAGELSLTSVNSDAGDGPAFGTAADPTTTVAWRAGFRDVLEFARRSGASAINVLAGARLAGQTRVAQLTSLRANLEWALTCLRDDDPTLLLEPLNAADRPSPLLTRVDDAIEVIDDIGSPRLRLLFDAYHAYQEEPDLLAAFDRALPYIGHVQLADFPGRGEPGTGEIPWESFLSVVATSGYRGHVGCEFLPTHAGAVPVARAELTASLSASLMNETADVS